MLALAISLALAPTVSASYPQQAPPRRWRSGFLIAQEITVGILVAPWRVSS